MIEGLTFYEFFAGGGMARAGLGNDWECLFANDFSEMKAETYRANWGADHFQLSDVAKVRTTDLPGRADLAWASFPCQDLSLAGNCRGLGEASADVHTRSGTFWTFWSLMTQLQDQARAPRLIVLENVFGTITSRGGRDFVAICDALTGAGYRFGAVVIDAKHFLPQSRPRLFFVAVAQDIAIPTWLTQSAADCIWHPAPLRTAHARLPDAAEGQWIWWNMAPPPMRTIGFSDIIEERPTNCRLHTAAETERLLAMMNPLHLGKVEQARASGQQQIGGVYKRTRPDSNGVRRQRAEVRFDDIAGCLRTPGGGSSRQTILIVKRDSIKSRLLSPREAARLMGLDDAFILPSRYNDAYHIAGDGVCVPVVRFLANRILEPVLALAESNKKAMAA